MSDVNELPLWVCILSALLTPTIAFVAIVLGIFNYRLAVRRRRDELFDRRYDFYQRVRAMWLQTNNPASHDLDFEDLIPIAEEAGFLFGSDIMEHIISLARRRHDGSPFFPNDDFVAPFRSYLFLERRITRTIFGARKPF